jgi:hypothetical protein
MIAILFYLAGLTIVVVRLPVGAVTVGLIIAMGLALFNTPLGDH